ncbi:MAG: molybdate transporter family protein [Bacillota bacterium]|nr:molybdate transporter family protein [Bacillota bacterium]
MIKNKGKICFSLREFSGAMGDFGTLIPLTAGYIVVCGLDPAALLITIGIISIVTGIFFHLPVPIEPMKVLAVVAIAQAWSPSMIYASGFAMGIIWIIFATTGLIELIARYTPQPVIRGIQAALGIMLVIQAYSLLSTWWLLGVTAIVIAILLRNNRFAPGILVLMLLGIGASYYQGLSFEQVIIRFNLPPITSFSIDELWPAMLLAGFAQIPLTATNAVLSTASVIRTYWPEQEVKPKKLAMSIGIINLVMPFIGGMPICHGAGGLAAKHFFGARSGGANISIGLVELICGLFFASAVALIITAFPQAIIGAMLLLIGIEMIRFVTDVKWGLDVAPLILTVVVSVITNMAFGFIAGLFLYYLISHINKKHQSSKTLNKDNTS